MADARPISIVVLISGGGTNLQSLIDHCRGDFPARIVAVISNRPGVYGLERATQAGIPARVLDHTDFQDRAAFDRELMALIDKYQPDLVVLAGFMRILTEAFVARYQGRLLNIHPSLLPSYPGLHTHKRALDNGDTEHGASVHFVTDELDGGPVILQASVPVMTDDDADTLAARVLQQEHRIYPQVVRWFAEGRLQLKQGKAVLDDEVLHTPRQLETS